MADAAAGKGLPLAVVAAALLTVGILYAGLTAPRADALPAGPGRVVLYSSVDDYVLREAVAAFEASTGLEVDVVGDTEATKTTGLVQRLLAEAPDPRADVWWSSEPFGTIRLARAGVLAGSRVARAEAAGWPGRLRGEGDRWYGFAQRARVIAYHTGRVGISEVPRTLAELTSPRWRGRVGIADPRFGTTRGHVAALLAAWGEDDLRAWLDAVRANDIRVYDGNATVVRAIANGEIDVGVTDTDDVWAAQRNGAPIALVYEADDPMAIPPSYGPLLLPNTAGVVAGGPSPEAARELLAAIVSPANERVLAESDSRNIPVYPELAAEFADLLPPSVWEVDLAEVASHDERAVSIASESLGR